MKHPIQIAAEKAQCSTRTYSGRNMHGSECLGAVYQGTDTNCFIADVLEAAFEVKDIDLFEIADAIRNMKRDNMGHDLIFYFPSIERSEMQGEEDDVEDEEEEDEDSVPTVKRSTPPPDA
jgi:hypothetical protein